MKLKVCLALLLAAPTLGCNPDIIEDAEETRPPEATLAPTPTPAPDGSTPVPLNLSGTFAYKTVMTQYIENAFDSSQYDLQTVKSLHVLTLSGDPGATELTFEATLCSTYLSEVSGSLATLNPGFFAAAAAAAEPRTVTLSQAAIGASFTVPEFIDVRGVTLSSPTAAMPTADDPKTDCDKIDNGTYMASDGVVDFDGDGLPGFTIEVAGAVNARLLAIERFTGDLHGTVYSKDSIEGDFTGKLEDVFICSSKPSLVSTEVDVIHDDADESNFFQIARIPEGSACSYVVAQEGSLFRSQRMAP